MATATLNSGPAAGTAPDAAGAAPASTGTALATTGAAAAPAANAPASTALVGWRSAALTETVRNVLIQPTVRRSLPYVAVAVMLIIFAMVYPGWRPRPTVR